MRILMLAPQPFYQERGTLIALDLLLKAISRRGDSVDLVTMHLGASRSYLGLRIFRIKPWFRPSFVRPGFSLSKVWCDLFVFFKALERLRRDRYDLIHAVEEASFMAVLLSKVFRVPFLYDMDSSMTAQIVDRVRWMTPFRGILHWLEMRPVKHAIAVIPMCDTLANDIRRFSTGEVHVLKDVSLKSASSGSQERLRENLGVGDEKLVMYIGNLEPYQGVDLLLDSFQVVCDRGTGAHLVIIGGCPADIEHYRRRASSGGIGSKVHFLGPRPIETIGDYMDQADLLVSPRIQGTNTPMKIYSYLDANCAVLATDLPTHTQVMDDSVAVLAPPQPDAFGNAMDTILNDPDHREELVRNARILSDQQHNWTSFERQVNAILDRVELKVRPSLRVKNN